MHTLSSSRVHTWMHGEGTDWSNTRGGRPVRLRPPDRESFMGIVARGLMSVQELFTRKHTARQVRYARTFHSRTPPGVRAQVLSPGQMPLPCPTPPPHRKPPPRPS